MHGGLAALAALAGCTWISPEAHMERVDEYVERWKGEASDTGPSVLDGDGDSGWPRDSGPDDLPEDADGFSVYDVKYVVDSESGRWTISARGGNLAWVNLHLLETGDPAFDEGCDALPQSAGVLCNAWGEYHDGFALDGGQAELRLAVVYDASEAESNQTTLLGETVWQRGDVSYLVRAGSSVGDSACARGGHDDGGYFARWC